MSGLRNLAGGRVGILVILSLVMLVGGIGSTGDVALSAPKGVGVSVNSDVSGQVSVSWNWVAGATHYRVGWIAERDVDRTLGADWLNNFNFVDRAANSANGGRESYTVKNLGNGETYHFIVGALAQRFGDVGDEAWSGWVSQATNWDAAVSCPTDNAIATKPTIIFGDLNWTSALLQNRIAQYIVEIGYGYPTQVRFGATLPLFQGLRLSNIDVLMEVWLPNRDEAWDAARADGSVISLGASLGHDWQSAFVIPAYLQEQYPALDEVQDLKDPFFQDLFSTAETGGKARLVSCVTGWACEIVNAAQVAAYGLNDHVQIVIPGDGAALNADLYGAYETREPWLGYQWGTNDPVLLLELVRLEEPEYSDECWYTTKGCAYEDATVLIGAAPDLIGQAPDVAEMLRKWDFNIERYRAVAQWMSQNPDARPSDAAIWWLNHHNHIWREWVTDQAETAIQSALRDGRIPDGWP